MLIGVVVEAGFGFASVRVVAWADAVGGWVVISVFGIVSCGGGGVVSFLPCGRLRVCPWDSGRQSTLLR